MFKVSITVLKECKKVALISQKQTEMFCRSINKSPIFDLNYKRVDKLIKLLEENYGV